MEQKNKENSYMNTEKNSVGSVKIADDVVAMIAAIAATEVEGVSGMAGNISGNLLNMVGVKNITKGAKVDVRGNKVRVMVAVIIDYGYNIPATSQYVQNRVKNAIENMTSLEVVDVSVRIAGVNV